MFNFFLDIKVKEQSLENLARGRKIFEPPRYMSISTACEQLMEIEEDEGAGICIPDTLAVGLARVGADDEMIVAGTLEELRHVDFGGPLHSLIIVGKHIHELEVEYLRGFAVNKQVLEGLGI
jgi:diphthine synthase